MRKALYRFYMSISVLACHGFAICIAFPLLLFSQNDAEFSVGFMNLLSWEAAPLCAALIGLSVFFALLPGRLFDMTISFTLALLLLVYIQGNFLVWDYGLFNGESINWSDFSAQGLIESFLWAGVLLLALIFHHQFTKAHSLILLFSILTLTLGIMAELRGKEFKFFTPTKTESSDSIYSFSLKQNVLIVILDTFTTPAFESLIEKHADLAALFNGFTFFPDALAAFTTTEPSIPAILSGVEYDNSEPIKGYLSRVLSEHSLPSVFSEHGYQVDVMSMPQLCGRIKGSCFTINKVAAKDPAEIERRESLELLDLTLFRITPQVLKKKIYNNQRWFLQRLFAKEGSPRSLFNSVSIIDAFERQANVSADKPTFKFLHLMLPHGPFRFDAECRVIVKGEKSGNHKKAFEAQASCALRLAGRMLETLKRINIFDNSLVIVAADHGYILKYLPFGGSKDYVLPEPAMPLLLLKPFGASTESPLLISNAPASLIDIPRTAADAAAINFPFPGESLLKLSEDSKRIRRYRAYKWKDDYWKGKFMPKMQEFIISGKVREPQSWGKGKVLAGAD